LGKLTRSVRRGSGFVQVGLCYITITSSKPKKGLSKRVLRDTFCWSTCAQMVETNTRTVMHWQQWLQHPERLLIRRIVFQLHVWIGAAAAAYLL
jgi:hypothetical protein